ncbi:MAG TPA: hypothetical protein VM822_11200 [Pseudolabrys sp.]|nr:hypothetical protein [Pseudolabrys sp.]
MDGSLELVAKMSGVRIAVTTSEAIKRKVRKPPRPHRRLRVYALDPSVGKSLDSIAVNETTLSVSWDDKPSTIEQLRPGPVGEYLEVVDVDPASNKVYDPVDLNDEQLLAQDGWPPSEGNPQFHQQMVYAVAMTTIMHFEQALGRKALWAPRFAKIGDENDEDKIKVYEVARLRLYPHALRTENAYYSPNKKAILFGYFPSVSGDSDATAPGSMVFACLSSDIIAHEMTHALLDGLHRRFEEVSNLDVPAFHEGFADIVALFQHFTIPELVRFEIGRVRGDLSAEGLLGGLAKQFGEGSGQRGPLRNYVKASDTKLRCEDVTEAHARGSILVYAVYEAFRKIVARRTADLVRLASGGSGVLSAGAIHPDLVERLTAETCKAAKHVLRMCIRALDYCPSVDITFGEYLRALITADLDMVRDDRYGYRVAFMESFRKWGILPKDIRTVSEETLSWNTPEDPKPPWLNDLLASIDVKWNGNLNRSEIFELNEKNRWALWRRLQQLFQKDPNLYAEFGLLPGVPLYHANGTIKRERPAPDSTFEVYNVRRARRVTPDEGFCNDIIAVIDQRLAIPIDGKDVKSGFFWFRGGATLIIDPTDGQEGIRYSIIKCPTDSRLAVQMKIATGNMLSPLRALYFGGLVQSGSALTEPFAMLHSTYGEYGNGQAY